jgi:hypothetical protein
MHVSNVATNVTTPAHMHVSKLLYAWICSYMSLPLRTH